MSFIMVFLWPAPLRVRARTTRTLARALSGGISIKRALSLAANSTRHRGMRGALQHASETLGRGQTIEEALYPVRGVLSDELAAALVAGSHIGDPSNILSELSRLYEERVTTRRAIVLQLTYPAMILFAGWYAIPFFKGLYLSDLEIMEYTRQFVSNRADQIFYAAVLVVGLTIGLGIPPLRRTLSYLAAYLYPPAILIRRAALARFCYGMGLMLTAGYSNSESLRRAVPLAGNWWVERRLASLGPALRGGAPISAALGKTRLVPSEILATLANAEMAGALEKSLFQCARQLTEEVRQPILLVVSSLEAIAIIFIGYLIVTGRF